MHRVIDEEETVVHHLVHEFCDGPNCEEHFLVGRDFGQFSSSMPVMIPDAPAGWFTYKPEGLVHDGVFRNEPRPLFFHSALCALHKLEPELGTFKTDGLMLTVH